MFWQIKKDLISLFNRGKGDNHFDPIDGLRSIANLLVILSHLTTVFSTIISPYPHEDWQNYLESAAFAFGTIMSFSLEIFFMLSSFLLTYKLFNQWNENLPHWKEFLLKEYPLSIVKRVLRLWPGLLLSSLILFFFGEPRYPNSGYSFQFFRHLNIWMFFQNYIDIEYWYITFAPLWSISLDMQIHILLPLLLYLFYIKRNCLSLRKSLFLLLLISIIRGIIVFNPLTMPVSSLLYRYSSLSLLSPNYLIDWLKRNYQMKLSVDVPDLNISKVFMHQMYLPLEARFGSFIVGSMLAIQLSQTSKINGNNKGKKLKKVLYLILICFYLLTMLQGPIIPPKSSDFLMKLTMGSSRQLFAIGQAFVLFSALCPRTHPYHSPWIRKFLSLPIWIPISKLSYFVYLIHWRISFELILAGPFNFLKHYSITSAILISLLIVLLLSEFVSSIWFVLVEKPFERTVKFYFTNYRTIGKASSLTFFSKSFL